MKQGIRGVKSLPLVVMQNFTSIWQLWIFIRFRRNKGNDLLGSVLPLHGVKHAKVFNIPQR